MDEDKIFFRAPSVKFLKEGKLDIIKKKLEGIEKNSESNINVRLIDIEEKIKLNLAKLEEIEFNLDQLKTKIDFLTDQLI